MGQVEWVGVALALAVLFWIPTHILTFAARYHEDYRRAGVPTISAVYGFERATGPSSPSPASWQR